MQRKDSRKQAINALCGRLGRYTNKRKTLELYYLSNSMRFVKHPNELTEKAKFYWDERNQRMTENIVQQIDNSQATRFILIVGAGHVISLENAIRGLRGDILIRQLIQ